MTSEKDDKSKSIKSSSHKMRVGGYARVELEGQKVQLS